MHSTDLLWSLIKVVFQILGISDKMIVQYILGLAKSSKSPADYIEKLRETEAVDINERIVSFSQELFNKVCIDNVMQSDCEAGFRSQNIIVRRVSSYV